MLLRDHPLMACKGIRSWPPVWLRPRGGYENTHRPEKSVPSKMSCLLLYRTPKYAS